MPKKQQQQTKNKLLYTGWLKTTEMYFLTVLEARSPRSSCWQSWFLLGYLPFLLCPHVGIPLCMCLDLNLLFLQGHIHTGLGPPVGLHPEASKPCSCPAVGPKKDTRYNDGDIHSLSTFRVRSTRFSRSSASTLGMTQLVGLVMEQLWGLS